MCGIVGFIDFDKNTSLDTLKKSLLKLSHRGPDGQGTFYQENTNYEIGLANTRLAIIDPSDDGQQPMISECKNYVLVFNGTIYNHKELKQELQILNYNFHSLSDTEVLLAAYIKWGKRFINRLNGIFAFCIYDKLNNTLFIARDNIGVKPLFFSLQERFFSFASEINPLKDFKFDTSIDKNSLAFFLKYGYFPPDSSIYYNVKKVNAGEFLEFDLVTQKLTKTRYWKLPVQTRNTNITNEEEVIEKSHELLKNSILSRTIADTNIGVLLSGGFDSATTAAIIQANNTQPINTFTIGFEDHILNESVNAKKIAEYLKTNHHEHILKKEEAIETIKKMGEIYDEPMGDIGAIALYAAVKFASKKVKVLLSSEGGDELFGGYPSYTFSLKWYPKFKLFPKINFLRVLHPKVPSLLSAKSIVGFYNNVSAYFTDQEISDLLQLKTTDNFSKPSGDNLNKMLTFDLLNYLPEGLMMKADRTCMYWGVENRDPMLDKNLVSYVHQIPERLKLKNGEKKYILKEIAYKYIPKELLDQQKKGFLIPVEKWLKTDLRAFVILELKDSTIYNLLDKNVVNFTLNQFLNNKRGYYRKVWILLALKLWANENLAKETI